MTKSCSVEGCDSPSRARGWCWKHYQRWRAHGDPTAITRLENGIPQEFVKKAVASDTDDCILWPGGTTIDGYPMVNWENRNVRANRLVTELVHGPPPTPQHESCHAPFVCSSRACINPRHLRWDTRVGNELDKERTGTRLVGESCGNAKLTASDVVAIRIDPRTHAEIAASYGVSPSTIGSILSRRTWRHV